MAGPIRSILPLKSCGAWPRRMLNSVRKGDEAGNEPLQARLQQFLQPIARRSLWPREGWKHGEEQKRRGKKHGIGRERPHFVRLSAAQNVVGSLPPAPSRSGPCFFRVQRSEQTVCNASRITSRKRKGGKTVATTESTIQTTKDYNPSGSPGGRSQTQPGPDTPSSSAQMRPTSSAKRSSSCSSGMTSSSAGWANMRATSTSSKSKETFLRRPRNNHEASFNPIRCAREYSVLKTACPALCSAFVSGSIR